MGRFLAEFVPPDLSAPFLRKVLAGTLETLAMSVLGTLLAACAGLLLAVPASARPAPGQAAGMLVQRALRSTVRWLFNVLRAVPELVWAALLLVSAGLGPMAEHGTRRPPTPCACCVTPRCRRCCRS